MPCEGSGGTEGHSTAAGYSHGDRRPSGSVPEQRRRADEWQRACGAHSCADSRQPLDVIGSLGHGGTDVASNLWSSAEADWGGRPRSCYENVDGRESGRSSISQISLEVALGLTREECVVQR
jgi:hypothetical protein